MYSLKDKTVVVTGGTGSLGKTLVNRVLSGEMGLPRKIIVFSRDEAKQHAMRMSYLNKTASTDEVIYNNFSNVLEFRIGDVCNYGDVCSVVREADVIINAAALKQVPVCEYFPEKAILTNCIGAGNIVRAILEHGYPVDTVVGISTDKACKPINAMGMTKALQERIFIAANIASPATRFICVRYGNVLASRGSVIPLFHEQIRCGGPVTVTIPHMTRFLLSLNQAVDTVFAALNQACRGEIWVPAAPSATVIAIAKSLIGGRSIDILETGIRPGEKIHEIMVSEEEAGHCVQRGDYYAILPMLPELQPNNDYEPALNKEFSSADRILNEAETRALLQAHGLLVEQVQTVSAGDELLR